MAKAVKIPQQTNRDARLAILELCETYRKENHFNQSIGDKAFVIFYNLSEIKAPKWVKDIVSNISIRTLMRWRDNVKKGTPDKLGFDPGANRRGKGQFNQLDFKLHGALTNFIIDMMAERRYLRAEMMRILLTEKFPEMRDIPVRTFQNAFKKIITECEAEIIKRRVPSKLNYNDDYDDEG